MPFVKKSKSFFKKYDFISVKNLHFAYGGKCRRIISENGYIV